MLVTHLIYFKQYMYSLSNIQDLVLNNLNKHHNLLFSNQIYVHLTLNQKAMVIMLLNECIFFIIHKYYFIIVIA